MIFGDLVGLKCPDIRLTGEEKPRENLTQETCPDRESNPGPLCDKRACYHLFHSGGRQCKNSAYIEVIKKSYLSYLNVNVTPNHRKWLKNKPKLIGLAKKN